MSRSNLYAVRAKSLVNSWETIRFELLNTKICDLGLQIEGSPIEPFINRLFREMDSKKLDFRAAFYLTDEWGCPDGVPIVGVPFYLSDKRLMRIEEEQTGFIEDRNLIMMLLRHEMGHAINYAYKLFAREDWVEMFGHFSAPYRDAFRPNPFSRSFVRHIPHHRYGRTYAQKHPDEDFAETFAVWMTPRSQWRRTYRYWPALRKLRYVDQLMKEVRTRTPRITQGPLCTPVTSMESLLAEHYGRRLERYRKEAVGYVDDKLKEIFPPVRSQKLVLARELLRKQRPRLMQLVTRWSGLGEADVQTLLEKLEDRADALCLQYPHKKLYLKLIDLTALATSLAIDFIYTKSLID